jgi:7,8-dihydropterin-6-yl-methyl-4-(beta-D-ribofuranosyl)aminobenzene 5'-phosphate synthase
VVFDNRAFGPSFKAAWGFACAVHGLERRILFDTGADGRILLDNMAKLGHTPRDFDLVLLSHEHKDHVGGLWALLEANPDLEVWVPSHFPDAFFSGIAARGGRPVAIDDGQEICAGAATTGVIPGWIKEQALVLELDRGLAVITGCAHPRITHILDVVRQRFESDVSLALGGFHLGGFDAAEIDAIICHFQNVGVRAVAPAHCTGDEAMSRFRDAFGDACIEMGAGREIDVR